MPVTGSVIEARQQNKESNMNANKNTGAVSPVIGVILMVAITVILAAVIGTFVINMVDPKKPPQAGVQADFDSANDRVEVTYISNQDAEYVNVSLSGDVGTVDVARLNSPGDRVVLDGTSYTASGGAEFYSGGSLSDTTTTPSSDGAENSDSVTVTAVAVRGSDSAVVLTESGEI